MVMCHVLAIALVAAGGYIMAHPELKSDAHWAEKEEFDFEMTRRYQHNFKGDLRLRARAINSVSKSLSSPTPDPQHRFASVRQAC